MDEDGCEIAECLDPDVVHYEMEHQGTVTLTVQECTHPQIKPSAVPTAASASTARHVLNAANLVSLTHF